ncbi:MAG: S49 family peptidase [Chloroflexi bacterium]|nr:S49 family peptidase [Chloroflexota bacterium]MCY4248758.1 S49 family peptidase [Chloroflexota bacterium]
MSNTTRIIQQLGTNLLNMQRSRIKTLDYVMLQLPSSFAPMPRARNIVQRQLFGAAPMSLLECTQALERIGDDPRALGVVLHFRGLAANYADLQTLRGAILRLREKDKRAIAFAPSYRMTEYFVASACDEILLVPGGMLDTAGMLSQQIFLKDGMAAVGLQMDSVAITPYKSASDMLARSQPSPEAREQTNWLLDSLFEIVLDGIATTRKMKPAAVREMIDAALHNDSDALTAGYIDGVMNEEALLAHLGVGTIAPWEEADGQVYLPAPDFSGKYVALLYAGGAIVDGESQSPPGDLPIPLPFVGSERLGDATLIQQVRHLIRDERCGALVLYIDSGGGSATASETMASALGEFASTRPLVACMGGVAASGGYYIATPAHWIVAQPSTITGSIGVLMGKLVNSEMLKKMRFNAVSYLRGENADWIAGERPFSDQQRQMVRGSIEHLYRQFIKRVADSRGKTTDEIDAIGGGRVWTGAQALECGLVDQLGSLDDASAKARALAKLPDSAPLTLVRGKGKPIGVQLAEQNPAAMANYVAEGITLISSRAQLLMPFEWRVE